MMTRDAIAEEVRALLARSLDVDPADVRPGFGQASCSAWTSLAHLMLISQLESQFGVMFSNSEIAALTEYGRIVDALAKRHE